jgi:hypothetical protein
LNHGRRDSMMRLGAEVTANNLVDISIWRLEMLPYFVGRALRLWIDELDSGGKQS